MAQRKPEQEALIKEFEAVRARYLELLAKLVELKIPGVIEPTAMKCNVGDACVPGSFSREVEAD